MKIHLFVLQHGMWGTPWNLDELEKEIATSSSQAIEAKLKNADESNNLPNETRIFNSHSSYFTRESSHATMDGIDACGERLFDAVKGHIDMLREVKGEVVTHISMVGYSLGGLITRYAVGKMEQQGWFDGLYVPCNFLTIATPHLGVWKNPSKSRIFAPSWNYLVPRMGSLTGRQLTYSDQDHGGRPLLINMSDPGLPFFQGLKRFPNRITCANIHSDVGVPYWTSSMNASDDPYEPTRKFFSGAKSLPVDPDNYPSIRKPYPPEALKQPDLLPKATPDQREIGGKWIPITALCLLPVLSPLIAYTIVHLSRKGVNHYKKIMKERAEPLSSSWLKGFMPSASLKDSLSVSDVLIMSEESQHRGYSSVASDDATVCIAAKPEGSADLKMPTAKPSDHISWMSDQLNQLRWKKIDVDCREGHAHAGIVVRMQRFKTRDHLRYMVQQMDF